MQINSTQTLARRTLPPIPSTPVPINHLTDEITAMKTMLIELKEAVLGNSAAVRDLNERVNTQMNESTSQSNNSNSCGTQCESPFIQPKRTVQKVKIRGRVSPPAPTSNQFEPLIIENDDIHSNIDNTTTVNTNTRAHAQPQANRHTHQQRQPVICCTESHLNNFQPVRPGKSTYARAAQEGRKVFLLSDSMCQRIRKHEFNTHIENGAAKIKCYPGDTPNHLHNNLVPHLIEECPHTLVIHAGTNSLQDTNRSPEQIADDVIRIGKTARSFGVESIIVTGLIMRKNGRDIDTKRRKVNDLLQSKSSDNYFSYVNNNNISFNDICGDRVHLEESGSVKLANNILNVLNNFNSR